MIFVGLACFAALSVIGTAALVRDWCAERVDRRRLIAIVDQVQHHVQAELGEEWTRRQT